MNFKNLTSKLLTLSLLSTSAIFGGANAKDSDSLAPHRHRCHTERCERRHENRAMNQMPQGKHFCHYKDRVSGAYEHRCHHKNCKHRIEGTDKCIHQHCNSNCAVSEHKCHHENCKHRIAGTDMCRHERCCHRQQHVCHHRCHTKNCERRHERRMNERRMDEGRMPERAPLS
jgi:hypothetical protein